MNVPFVIVNPTTQEIVRTGYCLENMLALQMMPGEILISTEASEDTHYFNGEGLVPFTEEQYLRRVSRPSPFHNWNRETFEWEFTDPRTLDEVREDKWQQIKMIRDAQVVEPKVTSVGTFDAGMKNVLDMNTVIAATQLAVGRGYPAEAPYTEADGTRRLFSLEDLITAALEMSAQVTAIYNHADAKWGEIVACQTATEVMEVTWD